MNDISYLSFSDELEKIARAGAIRAVAGRLFGKAAPAAGKAVSRVGRVAPKPASGFSLAGPGAIGGVSHKAIRAKGGIQSAGNLQQVMREGEMASGMAQRAEQLGVQRVDKALAAGTFNPKIHSLKSLRETGQIVPRRVVPRATPAPAASAREATTQVLPAGSFPSGTTSAATSAGRPAAMPGSMPGAAAAPARINWQQLAPYAVGAGGVGFGAGAVAS